uniref:Uncharacterized protein n=1 Tax=viral metagenome TaxID=1070528 RepID=A0A6M3XY43_9ZZZZ
MYCREHNEYYNEYDAPCETCDKEEELEEAQGTLLRYLDGMNSVFEDIEKSHKNFYEEKGLKGIRVLVNFLSDKIDSAFALELTEAIVRKHGHL